MRPAVSLTALVLLAGCGGSAPTQEEFAAEANAICREHAAKIADKPRPKALILFADYTKVVLPVLRQERDAVGALDPPNESSDSVEALLESWDRVIAAVDHIGTGAESGEDIAIVGGLRGASAAGKEADGVAKRLSLDDCAGFNPFTRTGS